MPNIGYDETMGAMGNFQYFIAPDVNYDFTIGLGLYSERGVQEQFEADMLTLMKVNFMLQQNI